MNIDRGIGKNLSGIADLEQVYQLYLTKSLQFANDLADFENIEYQLNKSYLILLDTTDLIGCIRGRSCCNG